MYWVYEKVSQTCELCYIDALILFKPLNTSITLLYTNCAVETLLLKLFITSNELKITLEKAVINLTIFNWFYSIYFIFYQIQKNSLLKQYR